MSIENAPEKTLMADLVSQKLSLKSPVSERNTRKSAGNTQIGKSNGCQLSTQSLLSQMEMQTCQPQASIVKVNPWLRFSSKLEPQSSEADFLYEPLLKPAQGPARGRQKPQQPAQSPPPASLFSAQQQRAHLSSCQALTALEAERLPLRSAQVSAQSSAAKPRGQL
ncbi:hypothetical protein ACRRTK_024769 [Alexandromys fortis]